MKIENKKGLGLRDAFPAVLIVSVIAILIVALLYMFTAFQTIPADIAQSRTNETVVATTAGAALNGTTGCGAANYAITSVYNGSSILINSGNYSLSSAGLLRNTTGTYPADLQAWNVSYTYTAKGSTCAAASTFTTQFANQIPLVGLVLTIVLIAIVIGVLVSSFFARRGERV